MDALPRPERAHGFNRLPNELFTGSDLVRINVWGAASLTELNADYVFFTPALLYTHGHLDKDVVQEWLNLQPDKPQVFVLTFEQLLFDGVGPAWGHQLVCCDRPHWPSLQRHLATVGIADRVAGTISRAFVANLTMVDAMVLQRTATLPEPLPTVEIAAVGLRSNIQTVYLVSADNLLKPAVVVIKGPVPAAVAESKAILGEAKKPLAAADPYYTNRAHP